MIKSTILEVVQARALLATVRHLMTGNEIRICEDVAENGDDWIYEEWEWFEDCDGPDFRRLSIQFYREITNWIDKAA